jgi:CubicO group peptidase (beta-lactamase class C family)
MATGSIPQEATSPELRPLVDTVREAMERLRVPGVAVGILHEGREHLAGLGVTNVDHPLPVDPDTLFQIGSTTKTVTGTAAMRLVEMGKLSLEEPIRRYLPELRLADATVAERVTLRHVFTHTGGWVGDFFDDVGAGDDALSRIVARMAEQRQLTPLGEVWSYNNAGFYLAGRVIEVVSGKPYEAAAQELVLGPLGMSSSYFFAADVITHRFAVGHRVGDEGPFVLRPWALPRAANAVGGIVSSARDQLRYARFHLGDGTAEDGTRVLSREAMAMMQSPLASAGNQADAIGITWMLRDLNGTRLVGHGGATHGQLSAFQMVPERQFAIAVLTNADRGAELHRHVVTWALRHYLGLADPEPVLREMPGEALTPYVGRYAAALSEVRLSAREGTLVAQVIPRGGFPTPETPPPPAQPPTRLGFVGEDRVIALDPPFTGLRGEFLRGPSGHIAWLRFGGRIAARESPSP